MAMKTIKMLLISMSVVALVSMGLDGCDKKNDKPAMEKSVKSKATNEHPTNEHPTNEDSTNEDSTNEDHPGNE